MTIQKVTLLIFVVLVALALVISHQSKSILPDAEGNCPKGMSSYQFWNGMEMVFSECEENAPDTGKLCLSNDECVHSCRPEQNWPSLCGPKEKGRGGSEKYTCPGITGTCNPIRFKFRGEGQMIAEPGTVNVTWFD